MTTQPAKKDEPKVEARDTKEGEPEVEEQEVIPNPPTAADDYKQLLADLAYATHVTDSFDWDDYGDGTELALKVQALKNVRHREVAPPPEVDLQDEEAVAKFNASK
jgi:hypothetical protein